MTSKRSRPSLGELMDPPPERVPREAVDCFLKQVGLQLELARCLGQTGKFDDAVTIQRLLHDRLKELCDIGDACIAQWTDFDEEDKRNPWQAEANEAAQDGNPLPPLVSARTRWTPEEIELFNETIKTIDISKRYAASQIAKTVTSKTLVQIRERLRREKRHQKKEDVLHI